MSRFAMAMETGVAVKQCLVRTYEKQHQNRFWYLRPDQLLELFQQVGAEQLIFGLGLPRDTQ